MEDIPFNGSNCVADRCLHPGMMIVSRARWVKWVIPAIPLCYNRCLRILYVYTVVPPRSISNVILSLDPGQWLGIKQQLGWTSAWTQKLAETSAGIGGWVCFAAKGWPALLFWTDFFSVWIFYFWQKDNNLFFRGVRFDFGGYRGMVAFVGICKRIGDTEGY